MEQPPPAAPAASCQDDDDATSSFLMNGYSEQTAARGRGGWVGRTGGNARVPLSGRGKKITLVCLVALPSLQGWTREMLSRRLRTTWTGSRGWGGVESAERTSRDDDASPSASAHREHFHAAAAPPTNTPRRRFFTHTPSLPKTKKRRDHPLHQALPPRLVDLPLCPRGRDGGEARPQEIPASLLLPLKAAPALPQGRGVPLRALAVW